MQSIIIVDDIDLLVDYVKIGPRFSNIVLSALRSLLTKVPPKGRRRLIIGTTSDRQVLDDLNILDRVFQRQITVPNISSFDELQHLLASPEGPGMPQQAARAVIEQLADITNSSRISIGVNLPQQSLWMHTT